jgi:ribosome-associated protein
VLDLRGQSPLADYFLILSGRSDTQVRAIADAVEERCRRDRVRPLSVEGARRGQWILLDFGDFVVHVFYKPVREFYDLERLWSRAPRRALPDPLLAAAAEERPALAPPR